MPRAQKLRTLTFGHSIAVAFTLLCATGLSSCSKCIGCIEDCTPVCEAVGSALVVEKSVCLCPFKPVSVDAGSLDAGSR
jgi:hypothetical protein